MTTIYGSSSSTSSVQQAVSQSQSGSSSILGKDAFLQLLVTQLANQDPTNPMEDREFIAQMAQFSSLEQMNNVASELRGLRQLFSLSTDLIGKSIEWQGSDDIRSGKVDSILLRDGSTIIVVGDEEVSLDKIIRVYQASDGDDLPDDSTDPTDETEETPSDGSAENGNEQEESSGSIEDGVAE